MSLKYSMTKSRPVEIYRYSLLDNVLQFNYSGIKPYQLCSTIRPGKNYAVKQRVSLKDGVEKYRRKIFAKGESRIRNMLLTIVAYESQLQSESKSKSTQSKSTQSTPSRGEDEDVEIYCHNGLHSDLVMRTRDVYHVVLYKNKLIFANTDDRADNDALFAYIGIKFETVLCRQPSPVDGSHAKLLLQGRYGRWDFKSVVEIDAYRPTASKTLEQMSAPERYRNYTEMKLCFASSSYLASRLSKTRSKRDFLHLLRRNVNYFDAKAEKWLFQCYFGRQDTLVVGIRNYDFELVCNEELDVVADLLPFVAETCPRLHAKFAGAADALDTAYENILRQVRAGQRNERDVFEVRCASQTVRRVADGSDASAAEGDDDDTATTSLFRSIVVPEYLAWTDRGEDTLAASPWVDGTAYLEGAAERLGDQLDGLSLVP